MVREASGEDRRGARSWTAEDEREAARWLGRESSGDDTPGDEGADRGGGGTAPGDDANRAGGAPPRDRRADVLARIRATPRGFVRTYGDVSPGAPRFAGTVLHGTHEPDLPWFRIVRADGSLTQGLRQRKLLEAEGVPFRGDKVDMREARLP
jgi:methylated-DNA-protein-cysteine methyltransferase related protein